MKKHLKLFLGFCLSLVIVLSMSYATVNAASKNTLKNGTWTEVNLKGGTTVTYSFTAPYDSYVYFIVAPDHYTKDGVIATSTTWYQPIKITKDHIKLDSCDVKYSSGSWQSHAYSMKKGEKIEISFFDLSSSNYVWTSNIKVIAEKKASATNLESEIWYDLHQYTGIDDDYTFIMPKSGYVYFDGQADYYTEQGKRVSYSFSMPYQLFVDTTKVETGKFSSSANKLFTSSKYY